MKPAEFTAIMLSFIAYTATIFSLFTFGMPSASAGVNPDDVRAAIVDLH